MGNVSRGRVQFTPVALKTSLSLEDVRKALAERQVSYESGGIGSVADGVELLDRPRAAYTGGECSIEPEGAFAPARLYARIYNWRPRKALQRFVGPDHPNAFYLHATDVLVSEEVGGDNSFLCLMAERDRDFLIGTVFPRILERIASFGDGAATLGFDGTSLDIIGPEFFRWLLYRAGSNPYLSESLSIDAVEEMEVRDPFGRYVSFRTGVSEDRAELLAMLMRGNCSFGPGLVEIDDSELELTLKIRIFLDGGFAPMSSSSDYYREDRSMNPPREDKVRAIVDDFAYKIFPDLVALYHGDSHWRQVGSAEFTESSGRSLAGILARAGY